MPQHPQQFSRAMPEPQEHMCILDFGELLFAGIFREADFLADFFAISLDLLIPSCMKRIKMTA